MRSSGMVVACTALAACGGDGGRIAAAAAVDTVAGVERVTYGPPTGAGLDWSMDTVTIIGDAMAEDAYQFQPAGPAGLAGDTAGRILVIDRQGPRVLEYGPAGEHRVTYGRRGEGPGELSMPTGLDVGPGDTVWVNDLMNRRLTGYPRDGGDPRTIPSPEGDVFPGNQLAALDGRFLQVRGAIGPPGEPIPEPLIRLDGDLAPLDTLWTPPADPIEVVQLDVGGRQIMMGVSPEFWPRFRWQAFSDGRVVVTDSADYVLRIIGDDGVIRIIRRDPPARATTDADRAAVRERLLREAEEGGDGPNAEFGLALARERVERLTFADRIPRIEGLAIDHLDRIWVGVSEDSAGTVQRIDIYDSEGALLGELRGVPMPEGFAGRDRILMTRTDDYDVPQIVVLRLDGMATARADAGGA